MTGTLIDSNVILDIVTEDPVWLDWSASALERCADEGVLFINPIIYSEVSIGFKTIEEVEDALPERTFRRLHIPLEAAFLAGKSFLAYRKQGGAKTTPLPDFFIGAQAAVMGLALLTRNAGRYRTYFPVVRVISP